MILKGYQLQNEVKVDLILCRDKGETEFQTVVINVNLKMYKSGNLKMYNFTH